MRVLIIFFLLFISTNAIGQSVKFNNISVEHGLSNSWVKSILKDNQGFIWFGTQNGLNRYDGYTFKKFKNEPGNKLSLGDNHVATIFEDSKNRLWISNANTGYVNLYNPEQEDFFVYQLPGQSIISANLGHIATDGPIFEDSRGNLWVGTEFGVTLFDSLKKKFYQYPLASFHIDQEPNSAVYAIEEDENGRLWFGTINGVVTHDFQNKRTKKYFPSDDPNSLSNPLVKDIHKDELGNIWLASWGGGLHLYQPNQDNFKRFQHNPYDKNSLSRNDILSLEGNDDGKLYIGTENAGLDVLDLKTFSFDHQTMQIDYDFSLSSNSIYSIFYDKGSQILWLGTFNGGVDYLSKWSKPFIHHKAQLGRLNSNKVTSLLIDSQDDLWIGTDGGGVNVRTPNGEYHYFRSNVEDTNSIMNDAVLAILEDRDKDIWIGTYDGGVDLFDRKTGKFSHFQNETNDENSLGGLHVSSLCEDQFGNIWIGTFDAGVSVFNRESKEFFRYRNNPNEPSSLSNNFVQGIFKDKRGNIYISTMSTLDVYNHENQTFTSFDAERLGGVTRILLKEDSKGNLWIGSANGLFKYDERRTFLAHYTIENGLPDNNITGIVEEDNGNLWLSTQNGIVNFENAINDNSASQFRTYSIQNGLQGPEFKYGAYFKDKDGLLYFGGQNGFNTFNPKEIVEDPNVPPVVITELRIFNKKVDFGKGMLIPKPILVMNEIELNHETSVITFEFAALGYSLPEANSYAYMMEGFEEDWNYVGNVRSASYTNLDPGDYTFKVKASNGDGIWNEEGKSLKVSILPPLYNTWWFKLIMAILFLGILTLYSRIRVFRLKQNQKELAFKVYQRTEELEKKNQEIAKMSIEKQDAQEKMWQSEKMAALGVLTAGVAHEINNPVGFIKTGLEIFKKEIAKNKIDFKLINQLIEHMDLGTTRITSIVKSLNSFSWDDKKKMTLCEIHSIMNDCLTILNHEIKGRIEIEKKFQHKKMVTMGNSSQLYQIFTNLLSNSIQAIEGAGRILIESKYENDMIRITIDDTGSGIAEKYQKKIFDPFFTTKETGVGTGLGLSIVYKIVEDHKGSINFESKPGNGTRAIIRLKKSKELLHEHDE